jgi:hypothetical protein
MFVRIDCDAPIRCPRLNELLALPVGKEVNLHVVGFDAGQDRRVSRVDAVTPDSLVCLSGRGPNQVNIGIS